MSTQDARIEFTALIDSMARPPDAAGDFTDFVDRAIEALCASTPVVFARARIHGDFASSRDGGSVSAGRLPDPWRSSLPKRRADRLVRAVEAHGTLEYGAGGDGRVRVRRLGGRARDPVEVAARKAGLSCAVYLDVASGGTPAATLQCFTDHVIEENDPLLTVLRLLSTQLESAATTGRFRAAIRRAALHGRQQIAAVQSLREELEASESRALRLEKELAEREAESDIRAYRARGSRQRVEKTATRAAPGRPAAADAGQEALYDPRTELPLRAILEDRIDQAIRRRQRSPKNLFAVLAVCADGLDGLSVGKGSEGRDIVTSALARRMSAQIRSSDTLAHLDESTFVLVLEEIRVLDEALRIAERIVRELSRPVWSGSQETQLAVRVGVVFGGPAYDRARPVLRDAASALARSRASEKPVAVFDEAARHEEEIRRRVEVELGEALATDQLHLVFQPIVSLQDGRIGGIEALLRWRHPEHGSIPPDQFIPIAAQSPLIHELGVWLLERTCEQVNSWQQALSRPIPTIDLNVTARQLLHERTAGRVRDIVARHGLRCEQFRFDISESDLMQDPDAAAPALERIRELGCRIAVDDFGTGFSSLRLLHRLPIDAVKIDRSFISGGAASEQLGVARTIVQLARSLEAEVIAEGVETEDQFRFLRSIGCASAQGYLFSAPVKSGRIPDLIHDGYPLALSAKP